LAAYAFLNEMLHRVVTSRNMECSDMTELTSFSENRTARLQPVRWLPDKKICERYSITRMTLYRWRRDLKMQFPQATDFNGRNRTKESLLDEFDHRLADIEASLK
jgi:predicted DNA-binding transcriptional regulator AlpA